MLVWSISAIRFLVQDGHQHHYPHADCHYAIIYCSAGGGIVADSQEEAEYQETFEIKLIDIMPTGEK
ncbi:hypothetical protein ACLK1S_11345 [Escherichia coli]